MKKYVLIFLFFTLSSCSFDNKTGIWKDAAQIPIEKDDSKNIKKNKLKKYEEIFLSKKLFKEEKKADPNNMNARSKKFTPIIRVAFAASAT